VRWALFLFAAVALGAGDAHAFCRTLSCEVAPGRRGAQCTPPQPELECNGQPIAWARDCVGFVVHELGSGQIPADLAAAVLEQALGAWMAVDCGGGAPAIRAHVVGEVACGDVEYNQEDGNANILVFRDASWPYEGMENALALTTVTFDLDTAEIYDTDIEVNTATVQVRAEPGPAEFDLVGILTHEAGHALGLGHSAETTATMFATLAEGSTEYRSLEPDDVDGVCAIYPPRGDVVWVDGKEACDPIPRHGFAPECRDDQSYDCRIGRRGEAGGWLAVLALALASARRRLR
jgi:matrixin